MFRMKVVDFSNITQYEKNVFRVNVLSLFLFNVYMSPLDHYIYKLIAKYEIKECTVSSHKFEFNTCVIKKKMAKKSVKQFYKAIKLKKDKNKRSHFTAFKTIRTIVKICYVRFVDDFLLGSNMDKKLTKFLVSKIKDFLKLNLQLN